MLPCRVAAKDEPVLNVDFIVVVPEGPHTRRHLALGFRPCSTGVVSQHGHVGISVGFLQHVVKAFL